VYFKEDFQGDRLEVRLQRLFIKLIQVDLFPGQDFSQARFLDPAAELEVILLWQEFTVLDIRSGPCRATSSMSP
jgi:hypothetical protein